RRPTMFMISVSALCGLLSLGLTSCADESDDEVTATNASGAEETEEVVEESEPEPTPQECLIGTWALDFEDFQDYYDSFTPDGAKLTPSGQILLSLDGENYEFDTDFDLEI